MGSKALWRLWKALANLVAVVFTLTFRCEWFSTTDSPQLSPIESYQNQSLELEMERAVWQDHSAHDPQSF